MFEAVIMSCLVCKTKMPIEPQLAEMADTIVCDECNENLEGTFTPGEATMYVTLDLEDAQVAAMNAMDSRMPGMGMLGRADELLICYCPRDEKRFAFSAN